MTQKEHPVDNKSSQKHVIVVKCFPDTPYPLDDCDFAVIEVTDDVKRTMCQRRRIVDEIRLQCEQFVDATFLDWTPRFFCLDGLGELIALVRTAGFESLGWATVSSTIGLPECDLQFEYCWIECGVDGVRWTGVPRDGDDEFSTLELPYDLFEMDEFSRHTAA